MNPFPYNLAVTGAFGVFMALGFLRLLKRGLPHGWYWGRHGNKQDLTPDERHTATIASWIVITLGTLAVAGLVLSLYPL